MPPRTREQGDTKQGLIIALVIFVLTTICLGVSTYFGFDGQEAKEKAKKKAEEEKKVITEDRDFYKDLALVNLGYMGLTEGMSDAESLGTLRKTLESGSVGKSSKDHAYAMKVLADLKQKYGWADDSNQPQKSLEGTIKTLNAQVDNLTKEMKKAQTDRDNAKNEAKKREDELTTARDDFAKKLADLDKQYKGDFQKSDQQIADLRAGYDTMREEHKKKDEDVENQKKELAATIAKKTKDIDDLNKLVQRKQSEVDQLKIRNPEAPPSMRTDWRIVQMDDRGTHPYINLGSADNVKSQLTFNIYGIGSDGRPNPQPKGTLEVVNVLGEHVSQTRITSEKDGRRDPILKGDVIYNASWNPNIKKRVAVAGIIDLTGDGRDSLMEFMRRLERQNIIVDAYEDPKDGSLKGQITYQTDYLILGAPPDKGGSGKVGEAEKRVLEGRKHIQDEAKKYGVTVKNLVNYLEMIGYPLPYGVRGGAPTRTDTNMRSDIVPRLGRDKLAPSTPVRERPQGSPPDR